MGCGFNPYFVKCGRYDQIIDQVMKEKFNGRNIDLFVLDVEGYEINVLEGMKNSAYLPHVFCIEYPMIGLDNLKNKLYDMGYLFDTVHECGRFVLGTQEFNSHNAFFVKKG